MFNQLLKPTSYYLNPFAYPVMLVGIITFFIGLFVLKQNKRSSLNIALFLFSFSVSIWLVTISFVYLSRIPEIALIWYRYFTFFGVVNIMPSLIFLGVAWMGEFKKRRFFLSINYIIAFIFYILTITTDKVVVTGNIRKYFWGFYPIYGNLAYVYIIFFLIQFPIGINRLYSAYKLESIPIKKLQLKTIIIGALIAFTASADFLPKFFNLALYPYGYISMFIYISLVAYSIVRFRAFEIETVIHKTIMWLFSFSFIFMPIFILYKLVLPFIRESTVLQIGFWIISFICLTVYLRAIQPRIDHLFHRRHSDLAEISSKFTEDLVHLKGLIQLVQRIEDTIANTLYTQQIDIYIYNENEKNYQLFNTKDRNNRIQELKKENPFLLWLIKNNKIAYRDFVEIDPVYIPIRQEAEDYFSLTAAMVVVPLVLSEKLLGIINLGKKANLKRYNALDSYFLTMLKNQSTIAISNSLLYENIEEQVRQRTKELLEVQKQLIQAEKLATVGTLAGGVAHEINNPLTAILTNVQMLLATDPIDSKLDRESLELIEEATKRCRTIVQKLMTYAKKPLETAQVSEVNLLNVLKNVFSFLDYQLKQDNIKIITEAKEDGYLVMGNQNELEQVLTNIILNARDAIKQIKKSGNIHISLSKGGDWIKLAIKDDGVGIPKDMLSKIFDPFFTTKEVGRGTGLGLSICQAIVEKHNGLITVQSEPHKGSVFTIQLPKAVMAKVP